MYKMGNGPLLDMVSSYENDARSNNVDLAILRIAHNL